MCFLFVQVVAIHAYKAENSNELSFEKGDIIRVLPVEEVFTGQQVFTCIYRYLCRHHYWKSLSKGTNGSIELSK